MNRETEARKAVALVAIAEAEREARHDCAILKHAAEGNDPMTAKLAARALVGKREWVRGYIAGMSSCRLDPDETLVAAQRWDAEWSEKYGRAATDVLGGAA